MSRYYDYDYDRNCIIGFGSDEDGLNNTSSNQTYIISDISPTSSQSGDSIPNIYDHHQSPISKYSTSPSTNCSILKEEEFKQITNTEYDNNDHDHNDNDEIDDDDETYILSADLKDIKDMKLIPLKLEVPFLLVGDMLKQQEIINKILFEGTTLQETVLHETEIHPKNNEISLGFGDSLDVMNIDCNLWIQSHLNCIDATNANGNIVQCQQIQRFNDYNGSYYNCFGTKIVKTNQCHIWRLQLLGNSPCIIGIIEGQTELQRSGAYFGCETKKISSYSFNTITAKTYQSCDKSLQPIYQQMLKSGRLDKPMVIDMKLDLYNGTMTIANKTCGCQHYGKEIPLFQNIDTNKSYKLAIALLGPETINLF